MLKAKNIMLKQCNVEPKTTPLYYRNTCIVAISNLTNGWLEQPIRNEVSIASKPPSAIRGYLKNRPLWLSFCIVSPLRCTRTLTSIRYGLRRTCRDTSRRITLWTCKYAGRVYTTITAVVL